MKKEMGDIKLQTGQTIAELCGHDSRKIEAVRKQWTRTNGADTGQRFDRTFVPDKAQMSVLFPSGQKRTKRTKMSAGKADKITGQSGQDNRTKAEMSADTSGQDTSVFNVRPAAAKVSSSAEFTRGNFRAAILIALMAIPGIFTRANFRAALLFMLMAIPATASVQNMHTVTLDICGHEFAAWLLTGLFSASPFLFVLAGMKNRLTVALVALLIAYEAFANFTRIYGGLTGFGKNGYPTRFLGLVTDIFNSGTHQTALFLAGIMSLLAASVFYAAYNELRK